MPDWQYTKSGYVAGERQYLAMPGPRSIPSRTPVVVWHHGAGGETEWVEPRVREFLPEHSRIFDALLAAGYAILACDFGTPASHRWGNDHALSRMDAAYTWLQGQGFPTKVALLGTSMGGMTVFNWAHRNVAKVACGVSLMGVCDATWTYSTLGVSPLLPSAVVLSNLTGAVTDADENVDTPDAAWLLGSGTNKTTSARFSFPTPNPLTGTQTFRAWVRKRAESVAPTCTLELWESGVFRKTVLAATDVTSTTGVALTGTWTQTDLQTQSGLNAELRVVGTAGATGLAKNKALLEVGAADWVPTTTGNISVPIDGAYDGTGTNLPSGGWAANKASRDPALINASATVATLPWRLYYSTGDTWVGDNQATPKAVALKNLLGANCAAIQSGTSEHGEDALLTLDVPDLLTWLKAAAW